LASRLLSYILIIKSFDFCADPAAASAWRANGQVAQAVRFIGRDNLRGFDLRERIA
jgi:hypothetical protein